VGGKAAPAEGFSTAFTAAALVAVAAAILAAATFRSAAKVELATAA
jgi:hypothetical protein